jgi:hypothetical protein
LRSFEIDEICRLAVRTNAATEATEVMDVPSTACKSDIRIHARSINVQIAPPSIWRTIARPSSVLDRIVSSIGSAPVGHFVCPERLRVLSLRWLVCVCSLSVFGMLPLLMQHVSRGKSPEAMDHLDRESRFRGICQIWRWLSIREGASLECTQFKLNPKNRNMPVATKLDLVLQIWFTGGVK